MFNKFKKLVYLGGIYSIGSIFQKAMGFFFIPIYTIYLSPGDYGIVGLMFVTVQLFTRFITPPVTNGFGRHYHAPEYKDKKGLLLFNCFLFLAIQAFVLAMLFCFFKDIVSVAILENRDLVHIVKLYTFILFLEPLCTLLLNFLRLEEKAKLTIFISWGGFLVSASVVLFCLIFLKIGVLALIYGSIIGSIFTFVCIFPIFLKYSTPKISLSVLGPPLRYGYPMIVQGFSIILIQSGDRYVIKIFSSLSNVGLYGFGYNFAAIMQHVLTTPLKQALVPLVLKQEGKPEILKKFVRDNCIYFYLVGMFLCLILSLYSKEAIEIMARRKEFWGSWVIVPVIAFSYLQHGLGYFFGFGLNLAKKVYIISVSVLIAAVVNIGLNFVFVPYWGILGAAFATLISYTVWNGLKIYYSAKFYDLYFDIKRLGYITLIGVGLYLMSIYVANISNFYINMVIKFIILLSYPIIFFITGFFTVKEKEYMRRFWITLRREGVRETYAKIRAI